MRKNPTIQEFIDNPAVDGNKYYTRIVDKRKYEVRYKLMKNKHPNFDLYMYIENTQSIYYHVLVPSELKANDYDVLIHMEGKEKQDLDDWKITGIFSNNPRFVFEFGYVYNKNKFLIPFLAHKYSNEILTIRPKKTNPNYALGYDHSVYFALRYLQDNKEDYLDPLYINEHGIPFNLKFVDNHVREMDVTIMEYNRSIKPKRSRRFMDTAVKDRTLEDKVSHIADRLGRRVKRGINYITGDTVKLAPKVKLAGTRTSKAKVIKPKRKI